MRTFAGQSEQCEGLVRVGASRSQNVEYSHATTLLQTLNIHVHFLAGEDTLKMFITPENRALCIRTAANPNGKVH